MIMYGAVIPSYRGRKDKKTDEEVINADDPKNWDRINKLFDEDVSDE